MKTLNNKMLKAKQLNTMVRAINQTAARATHLFMIALIEVVGPDRLSISDFSKAYEIFCNEAPKEIDELEIDGVSEYMIDKRLGQIIRDELLQDGSREELEKKMMEVWKCQ